MKLLVSASRDRTVGTDTTIAVMIQCGCGWHVMVQSLDGHESNWDVRDAAERALTEHLDENETDACRPWIHR